MSCRELPENVALSVVKGLHVYRREILRVLRNLRKTKRLKNKTKPNYQPRRRGGFQTRLPKGQVRDIPVY
jgi:hypothetical protein